MEADFTRYYQRDLRDLWRKGSGMTLRWVIVHIIELPNNSRTKKHIAGDEGIFEISDHILADIRDLLNTIQYLTGIVATKDIKPSSISKVQRGVPKRLRRPGEPEEEKVPLATPEELAAMVKDSKRQLEKRRLKQMRRPQ